VGNGEAFVAKIRHRICFAPNDIVLDPIPEILQGRAQANDVVIGADDPDDAVRLQDAPALAKPGA
jgi:hypothetical protein